MSLIFYNNECLIGPGSRGVNPEQSCMKPNHLAAIACALLMSSTLLRAAPPNDNFANRITLTGTNVVLLATNVGATREANEPQHFSTLTSNSVWYTWTAPSSGGVVVTATNSEFTLSSPLLAVYTGTSLGRLTVRWSRSAEFS